PYSPDVGSEMVTRRIAGIEEDPLVDILQGEIVLTRRVPCSGSTQVSVSILLVAPHAAGEKGDGILQQNHVALLDPAGNTSLAHPDPAHLFALDLVNQVGHPGHFPSFFVVVAVEDFPVGRSR